MQNKKITIALSKGRILDKTLPLLAQAGLEVDEDINTSRKLVFGSNKENINFLLIRASDVPTYVSLGAADLGVVGKDTILEQGYDHIYEPVDLGIAKCRLMTAHLKDRKPLNPNARIRVATKFANIAKRWYAEKGIQADIIKLYGGMELAPIMGLADEIVDIVDSGKTLKANGLIEGQLIAQISTRLIVNKASLKTKHAQLEPIIESLRKAAKNPTT